MTPTLEISSQTNGGIATTDKDTVVLMGLLVERSPVISTSGYNDIFCPVSAGKGPMWVILEFAEGMCPDTQCKCTTRTGLSS